MDVDENLKVEVKEEKCSKLLLVILVYFTLGYFLPIVSFLGYSMLLLIILNIIRYFTLNYFCLL
jgi:hypothetical protein